MFAEDLQVHANFFALRSVQLSALFFASGHQVAAKKVLHFAVVVHSSGQLTIPFARANKDFEGHHVQQIEQLFLLKFSHFHGKEQLALRIQLHVRGGPFEEQYEAEEEN